MRDFIDFIKYVIKYGNEQVYEQYIGHEQIYCHGDGGDPPSGDALPVCHVEPALGVNVRGEHLPVQHEVRLEEYLQGRKG